MFLKLLSFFLDLTDLLLLYIPMQLQMESFGLNLNQIYAHFNLRMYAHKVYLILFHHLFFSFSFLLRSFHLLLWNI